MKEVWIYIEYQEKSKQITDVSLELLSKGRSLANTLQVPLAAVLLGNFNDDTPKIRSELACFSCDQLYLVDHPVLSHYTTIPFARTITILAKKYSPQIILFGATPIGRDLAPRISAALQTGLTADCTGLEIKNVTYRQQEYQNLLLQTRPAFGGNIIATIITPTARPQMATVREGVMEKSSIICNTNTTIKLLTHPFVPHPEDQLVQLVQPLSTSDTDTTSTTADTTDPFLSLFPSLKRAEIVVAVGAGIGTQDNLKLCWQLAETLGGAVGATRAAVDKGLFPRKYQIGQTGITVRPKIYIACGISGAIQHRAGMSSSKRIVSFNNNPDAPIVKISDYAVIGDLKQSLPLFIASLRKNI
ncbi:MAG: electron transfer flavoprotein subunit alpha/FixB family protein [Oligoflexia bacterium]|nr:electron transfer flavoprotein subunit alpha/FixB family protein [Oligoflexia bacterium]